MGSAPKRLAFSVDTQICTGCKTCMVACKDKNDLPAGVRWRRVYEYSGGEWLSEPGGNLQAGRICILPVGELQSLRTAHLRRGLPYDGDDRGHDGIVTVDQKKCVGCRYCEWACPYGAPQYEVHKGVMTKCDFCRDERRDEGIPHAWPPVRRGPSPLANSMI